MEYDIIVVGAGHAGCEAAMISAKSNKKTALITINLDNIADMPCNPSIGGSAKGIVVREIGALGGMMARIADQSILQLKMLNTKKGPGVRSLRAQSDKIVYQDNMKKALLKQQNLDIIEDLVISLEVDSKTITGVVTEKKGLIKSKSVILTTGTYLNSRILIGDKTKSEGPHGERTDKRLSLSLESLGFLLQRLKTGTPPRLDKGSIDFSKMRIEAGDFERYTFAFNEIPNYLVEEQVPCFLTYTSDKTKKIIEENIELSSMYGGINEKLGIGPRYCPSIEDKIVRFNDKDRHQLFLEPESLSYDDIYLQGFSSSMPEYIQEQMVQSVIGLENAKINKYAYAIEYDALDPLSLNPTLESKIVNNLYTAGQINGTSGYEEAAGQGLLAGMNAVLKQNNQEPLILKRDEAYIGVLIDDLVTKGTKEPYRLLTSRAEYRLILRSDNADLRLTPIAYKHGFISREINDRVSYKQNRVFELMKQLESIYLKPSPEVNEWLELNQSSPLSDRISLYNLLKRPEISINLLNKYVDLSKENAEILEQVSISIKYEGYFSKIHKELEKISKNENISLKIIENYRDVPNLASEAIQKLNLIKPVSLGQASRISGVTPADIAIILVYIKRFKNE